MKQFLTRNKPVLTIGLLTLVVFIGLIVIYAVKPHNLTGMKKISNESPYYVSEELTEEEQKASAQIEEANLKTQLESQIDSALGTINIEFTSLGWSPKFADAAKHQKVIWTNTTDKDIFLRQRTPFYVDMSESIKIEPGKSYEMRVTEIGDWNYDESESKYFATIRVIELAQ